MKLRIDKLPKTDEDLEKIQQEVETEHHHHEEEGKSIEEVIGELYVRLQSLESKSKELEDSSEACKEEISRIYKVLGKMLIALTTKDENEKIKNLKDILSTLE
ncbi:hypothetical protein [Acidianus sp. HS-5]|uniref:hypothetical protein n=1 Tax=Acidianus sp. HS-5 TaxID=2886040 RepID=UPI001F2E865E|nr:hypothetical protein [Acidianus sp. HS-5]BDC19641.1 hypothetical protein HS5_25310 [Acidianus sp. HS-5]